MREWKEGTVTDLANIIMGQSPPGDTCNNQNVGIPLLNGPSEFGLINPTPVQYTTDSKREAHKSDILFCVRGSTTGRMNWSDQTYSIGRGLAAIRHKEGEKYRHYLKGVIDYHLPNLLIAATGSTFSNISKEQILNLKVLLPSLKEQETIADILASIGNKIELNQQMNEILEVMAKTLFKSWFVDFDPVRAKVEGRNPTGMDAATAQLFPGAFNDDGLPEGWRLGQLDDLIVLQRGFDLPNTRRIPGQYAVMAASGLNGTHNEYMVSGPGVTTGRSGVLGNVFFIHEDFWPLNTSLWIKEFKLSTPAHAYYLLQGLDFNAFNAGSAVPTLNRNHVHSLPIPLPPKEVVIKFDEIVMPWLKLKRYYEIEVQTLSSLRDALLPKLISGELRIAEAKGK